MNMPWNSRGEALAISVAATVICSVAAGLYGFVAAHTQHPLLLAAMIATQAFMTVGMVVILLRLPRRPIRPNSRNIEGLVREWLDSVGISVKRVSGEDELFQFRCLTASGVEFDVSRKKGNDSGYINIRAGIRADEKDLNFIGKLSKHRQTQLRLSLGRELARMTIAYRGLEMPPKDPFHVFLRVPISDALTEHDFIRAIDRVEAAHHVVIFTFGLVTLDSGLLDALPSSS